MKKLLLVLVVLLMVSAFVVGCAQTEEPVVEPTPTVDTRSANQILQDGKPFRFLSCNKQHPVVRTMAAGFWAACKDFEVDCVDNSFDGVDFTLMVPQVDMAINQGSSGVIPFTDKAVLEQDMRLVEAGIPSISIHVAISDEDYPGYLGWVAADSVDYAQRAAIALGEKLEGKGTIAITQGSLNDLENVVSEAFTATINENFPDIVVLEPQVEGFDQPSAISAVTAIVTAHPEITGAFGTTGNSAITWAKALEQLGFEKGAVAIIGMDYTRQNLDLVKDGSVYALVGQPLFEEVYEAVRLLVENMNGKEVPYANIYPAPIITIAELDTYYEYADMVDASGE